jgi:hypothetical protein
MYLIFQCMTIGWHLEDIKKEKQQSDTYAMCHADTVSLGINSNSIEEESGTHCMYVCTV